MYMKHSRKRFFQYDFEDVNCTWEPTVDRWDPKHERFITGRPYTGFGTAPFEYAGKTVNPHPFSRHFVINNIREDLEKELGVEFYFCLVGLYVDNTVGIPYHHDEIEHDDDIIASVSFGATRTFRNRMDETGEVTEYSLTNGDLLVFDGASQRVSMHDVPAQDRPSGPRINLTYRTARSFK